MSKTESFLRLPRVRELTGLSRATLYVYVKAGTFPAPYAIGARARAWAFSDVQKWIQERKDAGPARAAKVGADHRHRP